MSATPTPTPTPHDDSAASGVQRLLDRDTPADYLRECTERVAAEMVGEDAGTTSVLVFRIGVEWLALPTTVFQEIAEDCVVHRLPNRSDGVVVGIVNVRGEILVCASLGALLGIAPDGGDGKAAGRRKHPRLLVANRAGNRLAFPVDEVFGMHRYHPRALRPAPATLAESRVTYTTGLLAWRDRTVGCLDDELLFHSLDKSLS